MRLNHDCVRDVLLFIENKQELRGFLHLKNFLDKKEDNPLKKYDDDTIKYTLMKLHEAKYLKDTVGIIENDLVQYSVGSITWEGHKFLDTVRDPKIWKTTKTIAAHLESISITLISSIASKVLEDYIQKFIPTV